MDTLRGLAPQPGQPGIDPDNNRPGPNANSWSRSIRQFVADTYTPRGADGERHLNPTSSWLTAILAVAGHTFVRNQYQVFSLVIGSDISDPLVTGELRKCTLIATGCAMVLAVSVKLFAHHMRTMRP